ncbi:MAG: ABC transporter permease [Eubacterium sp.]|nr:ABC transporter permease [Eubacterium sp.]
MMKILRLSKAKIRKNKKESVLLIVLTAICMILITACAAALIGISQITPNMVKESGCFKNQVIINQDIYSRNFLGFLNDDERVEGYGYLNVTEDINFNTRIGDTAGVDVLELSFVSIQGEKSFENFNPTSSITSEEQALIEHPIYLTGVLSKQLGVSDGDEITFIKKNREYTFTVAGSYEPGIWPLGSKAVILEEDLNYLEQYLGRYEVVGINLKEGTDGKEFLKEYKDYCQDASVRDITNGFTEFVYEDIESLNNTNMSLLSIVVGIMAGITVIAIMVMIRLRIVGDIKDQIVSIGVLEALGYSSKHIAFSYVFEYMILTMIGVILGIIPGIGLARFLIAQAGASISYSGAFHTETAPVIISAFGIVLFVGVISLFKAMSVRKYPPVLAFRKGIETHNFKKSFLPLEKSKGSIHVRLAMKKYIENMKSDFGLVVCIAVTSMTIIISYILTAFFSDSDRILNSVAGHEMCDIRIETVGYVNADDFKAELEAMPEVDKVIRCSKGESVELPGLFKLTLDIYKDYAETTNLILTEGRLPIHENEIAFTSQVKTFVGVKLGETVSIEYQNVKRDYVITGFVNSMVNSNAGYVTESGFKQLNPAYEPDVYDIYLNEGEDKEAFFDRLHSRYGKEIADIANAEVTGDTYEERIRSAAEIKMAKYMIEQGVSYMEYTIQTDDTVISGSTNTMKINSETKVREEYAELLSTVSSSLLSVSIALMVIAAIVVMLMLSILMETTIRKQYRELGIMKGMGYTSRELMFQMAFRIIPTTIVAVIIGVIFSILLVGVINAFIAKITVSVIGVIIVSIAIILFCFLCSYRGARKIKKISVYELMTE